MQALRPTSTRRLVVSDQTAIPTINTAHGSNGPIFLSVRVYGAVNQRRPEDLRWHPIIYMPSGGSISIFRFAENRVTPAGGWGGCNG
ncbi:hypothetical protein J6590_001892 [Homalodisca vitripennis]|nr:hypothetical protein J6590_001892 [Homalodisca vitripennis]